MPFWTTVSAFVTLAGATAPAPPSVDDTAAAEAMFRKRCTNCHVPPDQRFLSDQAWLNQVKSTA